jgi:bisanhydrobacterioruberin hydratase
MPSSKTNIALSIAILFHVCGAIGILCTPYKNWFIQNTPLNLLLMAGLLFYTQAKKKFQFYLFVAIAFAAGMVVEIIGVNTGKLFGNYSYGEVMGYKINGVPLLIGVQWFVTVFCSGVIVQAIHNWVEAKYNQLGSKMPVVFQTISFVVDGAMLATFFDIAMEPVAAKLGFWQWQNGVIPNFNYVCWFIISMLLIIVFRVLRFHKINQFAIHLFIVQLLFFLALRAFL